MCCVRRCDRAAPSPWQGSTLAKKTGLQCEWEGTLAGQCFCLRAEPSGFRPTPPASTVSIPVHTRSRTVPLPCFERRAVGAHFGSAVRCRCFSEHNKHAEGFGWVGPMATVPLSPAIYARVFSAGDASAAACASACCAGWNYQKNASDACGMWQARPALTRRATRT